MAVAVALAAGLAACERGAREPSSAAARAPVFEAGAAAAGVDFTHSSGFDGSRYRVAETVTGGVAILDYDQDGWMDLYFTTARRMDSQRDSQRDSQQDAPPASPPDAPRNALYRNEGGRRFRSVGREAGVDDAGFSLGCAVADVDGNGHPDILVTRWGRCRLYRNLGQGDFEDAAERMGLLDEGIHTGAAFLDIDGDGDLDLYLASYVVDSGPATEPLMVRGFPGYQPPRNYEAARHHLYRNVDGERFEDISDASGIRDVMEPGRGLGVLAQDLDGDGAQDVYVANDMSANFLFAGDGAGRFRETGLLLGAALADDGAPLGSMGVDAADYDGDGRVDICVTNYYAQLNNLYRRVADGQYEEMARVAGISTASLPEVAWGVGFADFDNDGLLDLFVANGHLNPHAESMDQGARYAQVSRLFQGRGAGKLEDATHRAGPALAAPRVARGAAFGDLDNDGDVDIVVVASDGPAELLWNETAPGPAWCEVLLRGRGRNLDAIGAQVKLAAGGRSQLRFRRSSGSYLSVNDPRLHFGLGSAERIDALEVRWPDGAVERHEGFPARKLIVLEPGKPPAASP